MRPLRNARHETYATARAMGATPQEARERAGYTGPGKNGEPEKRPEVQARIAEIRDRVVDVAVKKAGTVHIVKGRCLYVAGDPARDVFLVRTGFMRLVLPGMEPGGAERTVGVALPWEVFGDEAFTEGHRRYGAVAGSTCA